jgi:hypothetical protein
LKAAAADLSVHDDRTTQQNLARLFINLLFLAASKILIDIAKSLSGGSMSHSG